MRLEKIVLRGESPFTVRLEKWATELNHHVDKLNGKEKELNFLDAADALVIFHENHNISKDDEELFTDFVKNNKIGYKIE